MTLLRNPIVNALFISLISSFYSFLFIFTSNHIEFLSMLNHSKTLQSDFWNSWSNFISAGNMRYVGYFILVLTCIILVVMFFKHRKKYDEFQISILLKSILFAGILSILLMPIIILTLLSDPNYTIETIFLYATFQWVGLLVADLFYVIKY